MNKLNQLVWIGMLLFWSRCNRYTDQQPTPDNGPPPVSVQALAQQYPKGQDIVFTTVANNQLWQADFMQQNQRYQALLSPTRLLTADQLVSGGVPDSLARLLESTVVAGGRFSNVRLRQYTWFSNPGNSAVTHVYADYSWQQQPYTASWTITRLYSGKITYYLELLPFQLTNYETDTPTEIPESLQAALRGQNLPFTYAWIQVDALRQRHGTVSIQNQGQPLYVSYDEKGQPIAVSNPQTAQPLQRLDQLPTVAQQYIQRPELAGFGLTGTDASLTHHTYGSTSTYRVNLQKDNQAWLMSFSDEGQLISRSFLIYGNF
ncbi:hypothetical protein [Spirosoma validum]|uniref:Uncharacterized protein n=1 Tax=Spirosoma validum TaxID=2771355 RepID=A0A927B839_9BACT|nr:hypothetical protein [Spirosoma validum]MBD2757460.1 hypothetical protein [Spirosoma validum]